MKLIILLIITASVTAFPKVRRDTPDEKDENEETTTTAILTLAPDAEMTPAAAQENTETTTATTATAPTTTTETSPLTSTKKPCVLVWICFGSIFNAGPIFSVPGPVVHIHYRFDETDLSYSCHSFVRRPSKSET
nr:unnamed protein product [Haemonchus contortus]